MHLKILFNTHTLRNSDPLPKSVQIIKHQIFREKNTQLSERIFTTSSFECMCIYKIDGMSHAKTCV